MKKPNPYLIDDENPELDDEWFKHAKKPHDILPPELVAVLPKQPETYRMADHYDFTHATRGRFYQPKKIPASFQLDDDVLLFLKKEASEKHISDDLLVNTVLRNYITQGLTVEQ
jgi:hypothetical protein